MSLNRKEVKPVNMKGERSFRDKKIKKADCAFAIVLCILLLFMIRYCNLKKGFFVDELWGYGLANGYYQSQLWSNGSMDNVEINPSVFNDYIVVNDGEQFAFDSVRSNLEEDSHPPLFFMVIHGICSFFPEQFSKWFGLIPNLLYFSITLIFLFRTGMFFFEDDWLALLPVIWYGISMAAVNMVVFVRMYMMFGMWVVILNYLVLKILLDDKFGWKKMVSLFTVSFLGLYTQYFFLIYLVSISAAFFVYSIIKKMYKKLIKGIISVVFGVVFMLLSFPVMIKNITGGKDVSEHSPKVYENLFHLGDFADRLEKQCSFINHDVFGGFGILFFIVCLILLFFSIHKDSPIVKWKEQCNSLKDMSDAEYGLAIISIACMLYFVIVSKITLYVEKRYMMPIYPCIIFVMTIIILKLLQWNLRKRGQILVFFVLVLGFTGITYINFDPDYLYLEEANHEQISMEYSDTACLDVFQNYGMGCGAYIMNDNSLELRHYKTVYAVQDENLTAYMPQIVNGNDRIVVYIQKALDNHKSTDLEHLDIQEIFDLLGKSYVRKEYLFEDSASYVYLFSK